MKLKIIFFFILLFLLENVTECQPVANFILPDSSCTGSQITVSNLSTGGTTYYWNFCSGNAVNLPTGINIGNPGSLLNAPTYPTLVTDGTQHYSFVSCPGIPGIIRYNHGSSFSNNPSSWLNLGNLGVLSTSIEGIQIKKDGGQWYGFINNYNSIVRLNFGSSLTNIPTATTIGTWPQMVMGHGLGIFLEGATWIGFVTCSTGKKLLRFNFGNSLANTPVMEDLGNPVSFIQPTQLTLVIENNLNYLFIADNTRLIRMDFGASLLNTPVGNVLGSLNGFYSGAITLIRDCDSTTGYYCNYTNPGVLGRMNFPAGITGIPTGTLLGNIGNLNLPHSFSELVRSNDTLFAYVTNRGSHTLTRFTFPPCTNSSVPSSTNYNPPSFSYNQPGTYNVRLLVNEGLPDQVSLCKTIVISPVPVVNLGPDKVICQGASTVLDAGSGFSSYLWSTGATSRTITVSSAGNYSVTVTKSGCSANDDINITVTPAPVVDIGNDTTICQGQSVTFDAGVCSGCNFTWKSLPSGTVVGTNQTFTANTAGTYEVTVINSSDCTSKDTILLAVSQIPLLTISPLSKNICSGEFTGIMLTSNIPADYTWTATGPPAVTGYGPGSGSSINQQLFNSGTSSEVVTYTITPSAGTCTGTPEDFTVTVTPGLMVDITITGNNNGVCAGSTVDFSASITNGGSNPSYQWKVNDIIAGTNSPGFSFIPSNGDIVKCVLTSSIQTCISNNPAVSDTAVIIVYPIRAVSVSITTADSSVCQGSQSTLLATGLNPGTNPFYQWKVNGNNTGSNSNSLLYNPQNNDVVKCYMTSSETLCITGNPAESNEISMEVLPLMPVNVLISSSANPVCQGISVSLSSNPSNPGSFPLYQWLKNGTPISALPSFTYTPSDGDIISCIMTSSLRCTTSNPATSNIITMIVLQNPVVGITSCFDTITTLNARPFSLKGGVPFSGTWSGPGVNSGTGMFTPSFAGTGIKTISYSYINAAGCSALATHTINVRPPVIFSCGQDLKDVRDNRFYRTVQIGGQCWFAENLKYGTSITRTTHQRDNCTPEKYFLTGTQEVTYQWDEMMDYLQTEGSRGLCPPEWHVPDENDWNILFSNWINNGFAGSPLKYTGFSGFGALLSGIIPQNQVSEYYQDFAAFLWSSTPYGPYKAWSHVMNSNDPSVALYPSSRQNAFGVRCIKN